MPKREIIKLRGRKYYVQRRQNGQFAKAKWTRIGKSLTADRRTKAKTKVKSGYGHQGDQKRKRRKR